MKDILGIDIGYGYTKTFRMQNGKKKFSTLIATAVGNNSFGVDRQEISVNGDTFLVGDDAETEPGWTIDTRTSDFVGSNAWLAVIGKALIINGIDLGSMNGMKLVFGLPPGFYTATEVQRLTDLIKNTRIQGYDFSGTELQMIPQGAGIYFTYLRSQTDMPSEMKKTIAVVDIGHYTIDTVLFSNGKYINNVTESTPLGVSVLIDRVRTEFSQTHKRFINNDVVLRLLSEGKASILQQEYSLNGSKLMKAYALQISSLIDNFFDGSGKGKVSVDLGIVAGGGVSLVQNHLKVKNRVLVMPNPDMANVLGYWYYGSTTK
jgi:plasmid segregation protein ParM